jgi:hypothetical protein
MSLMRNIIELPYIQAKVTYQDIRWQLGRYLS